jgi:hypothetical protein
MPNTETQTRAPRSRFVTVLAWISIVGSGVATFQSIVSNIKINTGSMDGAELVTRQFRLLLATHLVFRAATFVSSIGLLKRKNWARLMFIGLMGVAIVGSMGGVVPLFSAMLHRPAPKAQEVYAEPGSREALILEEIESSRTRIRIQQLLQRIFLIVLFAWMIKRFTSVAVRSEFKRPLAVRSSGPPQAASGGPPRRLPPPR